ncbi:MAG: hypothetical protein GWO87_00470 [Xanthomonadaceae bacterium]|nr:hypothetical protein [Rhodospirillaceae bacterium]NIA17655.1 hypothetical protein [Xanthomonadaceae bacterium]
MQNKNQKENLNEEKKLDQDLESELEIEEENNLDEDKLTRKQKELEDKEEDLSIIEKEANNQDENDNFNNKIKYVRIQLLKIKSQIEQILKYLEDIGVLSNEVEFSKDEKENISLNNIKETDGQKIIEGVFNGEEMIGPDGKHYSISSNYASKSKLVEGDVLKLIIDSDGTFIYKQIGPIERKRVFCILVENEDNNQYYAMNDDGKWKILKSSVTYFKGEPGDEIIILIPKDHKSQWAAVENIIKKS